MRTTLGSGVVMVLALLMVLNGLKKLSPNFFNPPPEFTTEPKKKGVSNKLLDTPLMPQADYLFKKMLTVTGSSPSDTLWR